MVSYQSQHTGAQVDAAVGKTSDLEGRLNTLEDQLFNLIYPVGAIYISVNSTSPHNLFGGTWEQIQGQFLLASSSVYTAGSTGGEATHTLTVNEMPAHHHAIGYRYNTNVASGSTGNWVVDPGTIQNYNNGTCIQDTGGGAAHNNMPPYLAVYMWKRTA